MREKIRFVSFEQKDQLIDDRCNNFFLPIPALWRKD